MPDFEQQALIQRRSRTTSLTYNNGVAWWLIQQWHESVEVIQQPQKPSVQGLCAMGDSGDV